MLSLIKSRILINLYGYARGLLIPNIGSTIIYTIFDKDSCYLLFLLVQHILKM
ncbi:hypothetical protein [Candidatus Lariskella endosymbiont of Epinotia ramella]|uniref:hypothetical protein n=1 Tax=Candidatus Lariskella endosymbiont of Epinotia ramella TaxID=3066224 RepID=UPI0030D4433B